MTEQEKRKRVKGMEDTIEKFRKENLCDHFSHTACALNCEECHLGVLVDAGYRKEEEVRKEIAKEIKETLSFELEENGIVDFRNSLRDENFYIVFNRVFKKFGVEEL